MRTTLVLAAMLTVPVIATAQTATAVQSGPMTYRISGSGTGAVLFTGAATGVTMCARNGAFSGNFLVAQPGPVAMNGTPSFTLTNAPPQTTLGVSIPRPGRIRLSGIVTDEFSLGLTVTLAGPPGVSGNVATVLIGGLWVAEFDYLGPTVGVQFGAVVTDWYGLRGAATFP